MTSTTAKLNTSDPKTHNAIAVAVSAFTKTLDAQQPRTGRHRWLQQANRDTALKQAATSAAASVTEPSLDNLSNYMATVSAFMELGKRHQEDGTPLSSEPMSTAIETYLDFQNSDSHNTTTHSEHRTVSQEAKQAHIGLSRTTLEHMAQEHGVDPFALVAHQAALHAADSQSRLGIDHKTIQALQSYDTTHSAAPTA